MRSVWKYALDMDADVFAIYMPQGAEVLTIDLQHDHPCLWVLVDPVAQTEAKHFRIVGTGHRIDENIERYIGTFQMVGLGLVFHLFELAR
jgi:hypothetical protein